jgi:leucyl aminopeptidase (aminopeptidase T)
MASKTDEIKLTIARPMLSRIAIGSIHIAIGKNNHIGGRNESSLYWDMVMPRPTIKADGKLVMEKGHM